MPRYDVRCAAGHETELTAAVEDRAVPCPVCAGVTERVWRAHGSANVIGDDIPGGVVIENLGHEPMRFYSKRAIVQEADRRGLQPYVHYVPGDQHLTNWAAAMDPYTLAAATALVTRRARRAVDDDTVPCETARVERVR